MTNVDNGYLQKEKFAKRILSYQIINLSLMIELLLLHGIVCVGTRFDLNPKREWIQAHVAQTMNL